MIDGLKPYPAMKESGVSWLGEVPAHWDVRQLKRAASRIVGGSTPSSAEPSYWGGDIVWITPADVSKTFRLKASERRITSEGLRACSAELVPAGSVVVTSRAPVGNVAIAEVELCTNQGCKTMVTAPSVLASTFVFHVLTILKRELQSLATGTTFVEVSTSMIGGVRIPIPPLLEQDSIIRFLDHADRRIRRYIRAKQQLIKLLEEQKQAVVRRAVTRGLDPNVRLKPSGVAWLGVVPAHWVVTRLKNVATVQTGITLGKAYRTRQTKRYAYLRVANVQSGRLDLRTVKEIDVPESEASRCILRENDVLMTEGGDIDKLGRGCVWSGEISDCLHQNHVFAVRCGASLLPEFLVAIMGSAHGRSYFESTAKKTTNLAATNSTTLGELPLFLPTLDEQHHILAWISSQTSELHTSAEIADREIDLLREYRTRLISDVVTGKLDVRDAAARLPDESDDAESLDVPDEVSEPNEADIDDLALEEVEA